MASSTSLSLHLNGSFSLVAGPSKSIATSSSVKFPPSNSLFLKERRGRIRCQAISVKDADLEVANADTKAKLDETVSDIEAPSTAEVHSLLTELCDETDIAELKIKIGNFHLHVKRDTSDYFPPAPPAPASFSLDALSPVHVPLVPSAPINQSDPLPPSSLSSPPSSSSDDDDSLHYVRSPKVGVFRRGRFVGGKKGKPLINEGDQLKASQVVGYLEQLGTQISLETDIEGEVVKFLVEDGDAVGYYDPVIAVHPSFQGIKKIA